MPDTSHVDPSRPSRRDGRPARARGRRRAGAGTERVPDDRFFRHIVGSMRNGVIAITRDGTVALMNDEAYRILG